MGDEENLLDQESDADSDDSSEDFVFEEHSGLEGPSFPRKCPPGRCSCEPLGVSSCHPDCCIFIGLRDMDTEADFSTEDFQDLELEDSDDLDDEIQLADQDLIDEELVGYEDLDRFNPHPYTPVPTCHEYCEVCDPYNPYDCHYECCDDEEETCMEQYEHCEKEKKCKHDDHQDPYHQGRFFLDFTPNGKCAKHCQYVSYNKYHGCLDECKCKEKCNKGPAHKLKECLWKCPCKKCDHLKHDQYKHKDCVARKCLKPQPHDDYHKDPYHSEDYSHHEKPKPKGLLPFGVGIGGGVGLGGVGLGAGAALGFPGLFSLNGNFALRNDGDCAKTCQYVSYNQYHGCLDECKCKKKCNQGPANKLKECLWKCPCKK